MTSLSNIPRNPYVPYKGRVAPDTNFAEDLIYVLQKPEEWLSNAIGRTFSDEAKYRVGSTSLYDANNFSTLLHSAGVGGRPGDVGGNVLAAVLGIGAAVLNPLDPLNYLGVGSHTRKGIVAQLIKHSDLAKTGGRLDKEARVAARTAELVAEGASQAKIAKETRNLARNIDVANEFLAKFPNSGDLDYGKTFFERVRKGQQTILGLDPYQNPIIRGITRTPGTGPQRGATSFRSLDLLVANTAQPVFGVGRKAMDEVIAPLLNKLGANIPTSDMARTVHRSMAAMNKAIRDGKIQSGDEVTTFLHELRAMFGEDEQAAREFFGKMREAVDYLEVPESSLASKQLLKKTLDTQESLDRIIRTVTEPGFQRPPMREVLSQHQKRYIAPEAAEDAEDFIIRVREGTSAGAFPTPYGTRHKNNDLHVLDVPIDTPSVRSSVKRLDKAVINVPGIAPFRYKEAQGRLLVYTQNLVERETQKWAPHHMQTLEKMAAMLSAQGYVLRDLDPRAFAIGADGTVQLIDPTLIRKAKRAEDAVGLNQDRLRQLASQVGLSQDIRWKALKSLTSAKEVKATDFVFRDVVAKTAGIQGSKDLKYILRDDLEQVVEWTDDYVDLERLAEGDRAEVLRYVKQLEEQGTIEPVVISTDGYGRLHVRDSVNKIRALHLAGAEHVPVINVGHVGDIPRAGVENVSGAAQTFKTARAIEEVPSPYGRLQGAEELLDQTVRILDPQGGFWEVDARALQGLDREDFVGRVGAMLSRRSSREPEVRTIQDTFQSVEDTFRGAIGGDPAANLRLATRLDQSQSLDDLAQVLSEELGYPVRFRGVTPQDQFGLQQEFLLLRQLAAEQLDRLAIGHGVFTTGRTHLLDEFTRQSSLVALRSTNAGLEVSGVGFDLERLQGLSEGLVTHGMNLADSERILMRAADGQRQVTAGSLVTGTRPLRTPLVEDTSQFFTSPVLRDQFRKQGILVEGEAIEGVQSMARSLQGGRHMAGFVSPSGELVIGTRHRTPEGVLNAVYGDSEKHAQELLTISPKAIHVSNLMGIAGMGELNAQTLKRLSGRIHRVARKLSEAGFGDDLHVVLHAPSFPDEVWREMLQLPNGKSARRLGELADPSFRLEMPDLADGTALNLIDMEGVSRVRSRAQLLKKGSPMRKLVEHLEENFDQLYVSQAMQNLPVRYVEGYYARILHPEIQNQLNDLFRSFVGAKGGRVLEYWNSPQFKGRSFTELTTEEVNQFWREINSDPSELLRYGKNQDHSFIKALAIMDIDTAEFFLVDNPLLSLKVAMDRAFSASNRKAVFDQLTDPDNGIALYSGTSDEINRWLNHNRALQGVDEELQALRETEGNLIQAQKERQLADGDPQDLEEIARQLEEVQGRKDVLANRKVKAIEEKLEAKVRLSGDITRLDEVVIDKAEARRLMQEEGWEASLFEGDWSNPYMRLRVKTLAERNPKNLKVHVFHEEVFKAMDALHRAQGPGAFPELFKQWEAVTGLWRRLTLFAPPSFIPYTSRNILSNFLLGAVGGLSVNAYREAVPIFKRVASMWRSSKSITEAREALKNITIRTPLNDVIRGDEIWQQFVLHGGVSGGIHVNEFGLDPTLLRVADDVGIPGSAELIGPSGFLDNKLMRFGQAIPQAQETYFRLASFVDALQKGASFEQAALNVKRLFYNYDELTAFERKILRNVIPFYSWMRFNTPRMIETVFTNPVFHIRLQEATARIEQGAGGPAADEELTEFFQRMMPITLGRKDGKLILVTADSTIPMADAYKVMASAGGGFSQVVLDGLSPLLKVPIETLVNYSLFSRRPISRLASKNPFGAITTPEPARSFTLSSLGANRGAEYLLSQVRPIKMTSQFLDTLLGQTNLRGERPVWWAGLTDLTITRMYQADPNRAKIEMELRNEELQSAARWLIREGARTGRDDLQAAGQRLLVKSALNAGQ